MYNMEGAPKHSREHLLFELFHAHKIETETVEHKAVFKVDEGKDIKARLPGGHTKNLFLKDKGGQYVLISAIADTPIKLNQLHKVLGTKRLSFGKEDALYDYLGVRPGSVTLFSVMNDTNCEVQLVLDKALFKHNRVWFHPLRNTASTAIYSSDIKNFAKAVNHEPILVDFHELAVGF